MCGTDRPNAVSSYECLQDGETDHIQRWNEFIHIPDLSDQKAQQRLRMRDIQTTKERLKNKGVLLLELTGERPQKGILGTSRPVACPTGDDGFLVTWSRHLQTPEKRSLQHYRGPLIQDVRNVPIELSTNIYKIVASPSGRFLGTGHAAGNWSVEIWDLANSRRIAECAIRRATDWIGFTADESLLVAYSHGEVTAVDVTSGQVRSRFETKGGSPRAVTIHPSGWLLTGDQSGRMTLWDLATGQRLKTLCMGGVTTSIESITTALGQATAFAQQTLSNDDWMQKQRATFETQLKQQEREFEKLSKSKEFSALGLTWDKFKESLLKNMEQGFERQRQQMEQFVRDRAVGNPEIIPTGSMRATCLAASRSGKWIGCGTENGFAVFEWQDIESAADRTELLPTVQFENESSEITRHGMTMKMPCRSFAVTFDDANQHLLVGCQDGKVRMINLESGQSGVLLSLPEPMWIIELGLSSDRNALTCLVQDFEDQMRPTALQFWNYRELLNRSTQLECTPL